MKADLRGLLVAAVALLPLAASAQIVNVQTRFSAEPEPGLHGAVEGALDWRTGNTEYLLLRGALSGAFRTGPHVLLGLAQAERALSGEEVTLYKTFEHLRYRYRWTDLLRPEAFLQHEIDRFRRLELRALVGAGLRFELLEGETHELATGLALMAEHERLRDSAAAYTDLRLSAYALGRVRLMENVELVQTLYFQPRLDRPGDLRLLDETGLVLTVNERLAVTASLLAQWDTAPPEGVEALDVQVRTGLAWRW